MESRGARLAVMHATFPIAAAMGPKTGTPKGFIRLADAAHDSIVECRPDRCELLNHQEMLVRELEHRTINTLQIIASMISMKARTVQSDEARGHLEDIRQRVLSVATIQRHLHISGGGKSVEMSPYLMQLCESLTKSMIESRGPVSLFVRAAGALPTREAENIGLVVTELVINALKHAFPGSRGGEIRVSYGTEGDGWRLSVSDNGVGRQPDDQGHVGTGTRIIALLARDLDAHVENSSGPQGTTVTVIHAAGPTGAIEAS
jgi:chemotaxis protein methyltransferase CheR